MDLNNFLQWLMDHNVVLIEILFVVILVGVSLVLFTSVVSKDQSSEASLSEMEKLLRKALDATGARPSAEAEKAAAAIKDDDEGDAKAPPPAVAAAAPPPGLSVTPEQMAQMKANQAQIDQLKKDVSDKEKTLSDTIKQLEEAKKAMTAAAGSGGDTKPLEEKIKELQAKLAEYEIIEDDIANLSNYKNENSKLKEELEALKGRLGSKTLETGTSSDNVRDFAALMGVRLPDGPAATAQTTTTQTTPPPAAAAPVAPAPAPSPVADTAPTPVAAPPPATPTPAVAAAEPAAAPTTSPTAVPAAAPVDSLLGPLDTDKMLSETAKLAENPPKEEAKEGLKEDGDVGQKLINEFENFMKGS